MSTPCTYNKREELLSQFLTWLEDARVGTSTLDGLNYEMTTKLKKFMKLSPQIDHHPIVRQLFNWLSNPQQSTAEDFIYVMGLVRQNCNIDIGCSFYLRYLGNVVIGALADRCPILEGSWEQATWSVLEFAGRDEIGTQYSQRFPSIFLSAWIIYVIGDPDICPNPQLRLKLLHLFMKLVIINDQNRTLALQSVMSAISSLKFELEEEHCNVMNTSLFNKTLEKFTNHGYLLKLDKSLSKKLNDMKTFGQSAIIHDVSYIMRMNPNRFTYPIELQSITTLLKFTSRQAQAEYKLFQGGHFIPDQSTSLNEISRLLRLLLCNFTKTCQMPHLIEISTLCIIDVVELVVLVNGSQFVEQGYPFIQSLLNCEEILNEFCIGRKLSNRFRDAHRIVTSLAGQIIIQKYHKRLSCIQTRLEDLEFDEYRNYLRPSFPVMYH
ncbi:unnamed protein product, partial [Meganyctiphanes norvegica]